MGKRDDLTEKPEFPVDPLEVAVIFPFPQADGFFPPDPEFALLLQGTGNEILQGRFQLTVIVIIQVPAGPGKSKGTNGREEEPAEKFLRTAEFADDLIDKPGGKFGTPVEAVRYPAGLLQPDWVGEGDPGDPRPEPAGIYAQDHQPLPSPLIMLPVKTPDNGLYLRITVGI